MTYDRHAMLLLLWHANVRGYGVKWTDWLASARDWTLHPVTEGDKLIAAVMQKDNELHIASLHRPKGSTRSVVRRHLEQVVKQYGSAKAAVMADNPASLRFCQRLGFEIEGEDNGIIRLTCTRPRHA